MRSYIESQRRPFFTSPPHRLTRKMSALEIIGVVGVGVVRGVVARKCREVLTKTDQTSKRSSKPGASTTPRTILKSKPGATPRTILKIKPGASTTSGSKRKSGCQVVGTPSQRSGSSKFATILVARPAPDHQDHHKDQEVKGEDDDDLGPRGLPDSDANEPAAGRQATMIEALGCAAAEATTRCAAGDMVLSIIAKEVPWLWQSFGVADGALIISSAV